MAQGLMRAYVERELARSLHLSVRLGGLSLSLRPGGMELRQIAVSDPADRFTLLTVDRMRVGLRLTSLLRGRLRVRSVVLHRPLVTIEDTLDVRAVLAETANAVGSARGLADGSIPVRVEYGAALYRHPGAGVAIALDNVHGSLKQDVIETEQFTVNIGTHPPALTAEARNGERSGGRDECLRGRLRGRVRTGLLTVDEFLLTCGESRLALKGTADPVAGLLALTADMTLADLDRDLPLVRGQGLSGSLQLSGRIDGPFSRPRFAGQLLARQLQLQGWGVDLMEGPVHIEPFRIAAQALRLSAGDTAATLSGRIELGEQWKDWSRWQAGVRLSLAVDLQGRIEDLLPLRQTDWPVAGAIMLHGRITERPIWRAGQWTVPRVEGTFELSELLFRSQDLGNGTGDFTFSGTAWRWDLTLPRTFKAHGVVPAGLHGQFQAELTALDLDVTPFMQGVSAYLPSPFMVRADGTASLRGSLPAFSDLTGRIDLTALRGRIGSIPWHSRGPIHITLGTGAFRIEPLDLVGSGLALNIQGNIRPGEQLNLTLAGSVPPEVVMHSAPALEDLRGSPSGRLSLIGPPGDLTVSGGVDLAGIEARLKAIPIRLSVTSGEMRFSRDNFDYKILQGAIGEGRLEGTWAMRREGPGWRHTVDISVDKARLDQLYRELQWDTDWVLGHLSARGSLTFDTAPALEPLRTLQGRLAVAIREGSLARYPALVRIFGLLGSPAQLYRLPDLTRDRMPYRKLSAEFNIKDGIMDTKNLLLDSEVVRVSGVGTVNPAEARVDLNLGVRPLQFLERGIRKIPILGWALPKRQSLIITYFRMQGPWDDPVISINPVQSLSQTLVDILLLPLRVSEQLLKPGR